MKFKPYVLHNTRNISRISAPSVNCKGAQWGAGDHHEKSNTSNFDEIYTILHTK